jgi:F-type H+-transporting ATPase subunit b
MTGVPLNIDWQQILLHLFNFTILFGALYILLYKPVKDFMAKREEYYRDMDSKATQAAAEAESRQQEYEKKISDLETKIRDEKSRMGKEVEAERERRLGEAKSEAEKIVADARTEADREKSEILASAQKDISDMVTGAVEKLALEQSASDAFDQFLDAAEEADHE